MRSNPIVTAACTAAVLLGIVSPGAVALEAPRIPLDVLGGPIEAGGGSCQYYSDVDATMCGTPFDFEWSWPYPGWDSCGYAHADADSGDIGADVYLTQRCWTFGVVGSWFQVPEDGWYAVTFEAEVAVVIEEYNGYATVYAGFCSGSASNCDYFEIPRPDDGGDVWTFGGYGELEADQTYIVEIGAAAWNERRDWPASNYYGEGRARATALEVVIEPYTGAAAKLYASAMEMFGL